MSQSGLARECLRLITILLTLQSQNYKNYQLPRVCSAEDQAQHFLYDSLVFCKLNNLSLPRLYFLNLYLQHNAQMLSAVLTSETAKSSLSVGIILEMESQDSSIISTHFLTGSEAEFIAGNVTYILHIWEHILSLYSLACPLAHVPPCPGTFFFSKVMLRNEFIICICNEF